MMSLMVYTNNLTLLEIFPNLIIIFLMKKTILFFIQKSMERVEFTILMLRI